MVTAEKSASTDTQHVIKTDREAIIFVPAIGKEWDDPSFEGVARRMAIAIDRQSTTKKAKAHVEVADQNYGAGYKCKKFTIVKSEGKTERPLIDVFGLDYNDTLVETYAKRNLFIKILLLTLALADSAQRLIFRARQKSKSLKEKIQLAYGLALAFLLIVYLVILIAAVVVSVKQLTSSRPNNAPGAEVKNTPQADQNVSVAEPGPLAQSSVSVPDRLKAGVKKTLAAGSGLIKTLWIRLKDPNTYSSIVVLMTALGFVLPQKSQIKERISLAATNYLCLIHYLNWGERNHAIGGKLESLMEFVSESDNEYRKIHIVAYSFGSIVALDNLFTWSRKPIDRFSTIDTLVTIGCPFDIIRAYWPNYFKERQSLAPNSPKWINVYSPIDILSSNFADVGNEKTASEQQEIGVEVQGSVVHKPENISFCQGSCQGLGLRDILTLTGFRAHAMYWGEEFKGEITCFHDIVKKMYGGTSVLN